MYTRTEQILLPYYPLLVYLELREQGFDDRQIFDGSSLSVEKLHDEKYRLSIEEHEHFILHVLAITKNPNLAIQLAKQQDPSTANLALITVANSGKISTALHMIERYNKNFTRVFSISSLETDNHGTMDIETHLEHDSVVYFSISAFVLFIDKFFLESLKGAHLIQQVELAISKPTDFDAISDEFPFPMKFNQSSFRIYFNKELLDKKMKHADPQTVRLLTEMSDRQLAEAEAEMSFIGSVKSVLLGRISSPPKLDEAAKILGVSSRGLRRKLEASGTTYQSILDSVRLKVATKLIKETASPISSIAYELGYSNASDFGRAFKKLSGQSPASIRDNS